MGGILQKLSNILLLPSLLYFLEPALDEVFSALGIDSKAWAVWLIDWLQSVMSNSWFSLVVVGGLSLFIGIWLHHLATRFDQRKSERLKSLAPKISALKTEIWRKAEHSDGSYQFAAPDRQLRNKLIALYQELNKAGVETPNIDRFNGPFFTMYAEHYLMAIEPFAEYGQHENASLQGIAKTAETEISIEKIRKDIGGDAKAIAFK